jgi:hypothetical protein
VKTMVDTKNRIRKYVVGDLIANYQLGLKEAEDLVSKSTFSKLLEDNYEFVVHYNTDYWARDIYKEFHPSEAETTRAQ